MNEAQRAVTNGNVDRLFDLILDEPDGQQRRLFHSIMLAEEQRFANLTECLEMVAERLQRCDGYIARQKEHLASDGSMLNRGEMERTLEVLIETRQVLLDYRTSVRKALASQ